MYQIQTIKDTAYFRSRMESIQVRAAESEQRIIANGLTSRELAIVVELGQSYVEMLDEMKDHIHGIFSED
jgi:hypothetical protein